MKLSLALFSAALATAAASDCDCPCGNGLGVWVDQQVGEDCAPKRTCAGHSVARLLVEGDKATCVDECPESCAPEPRMGSPSSDSGNSDSGSGSRSAKSPKERSPKSPKVGGSSDSEDGSSDSKSGKQKRWSPKDKSPKDGSSDSKDSKDGSGSKSGKAKKDKSPKDGSSDSKDSKDGSGSKSGKAKKDKSPKDGSSDSKDSKDGSGSKSGKNRRWGKDGSSDSKSGKNRRWGKDDSDSKSGKSRSWGKKKSKAAKCPQYSKTVDPNTNEELNPYVPKPEFCQLKRATSYLKFEPNFPEGRPDVYIEVKADEQIFKLYPDNYDGECSGPFYEYLGDGEKEGSLLLGMDSVEFITLYNEQEKMGGTGFQFRFVSKNGPGEWNSCSYSPIAFDLNGNGVVEHITRPEGWFIDITGDGDIEHLSEWFAPDEGILIDVHKEVENGEITGHHLVGDMGGKYTDGFAKLAGYDTDCDNEISGDELENFRIWKDANSNAKLDDGELYKLSDFGIVALSTVHDNLRSHATLEDGSTMMMEDLWFDPFERRRRLEAARAKGFKI